jgi:DNA repair protein RecO (recombination protein O)
MNAGRAKVEAEPAFVLHSHPFRETSLLVEIFSRNCGRVALVARGARRPRSSLRGVLLAFQPLQLEWFGQGEVRTLGKAEWQGGQPLLGGRLLLCGYYANELLLRLLPREDSYPALFEAYAELLRRLASGDSEAVQLRRFEQVLLRELGYGPTLDREADGARPVAAEKRYAYVVERGLVEATDIEQPASLFTGRALLAMAAGDFSEPETLQQSKVLMRVLINHYLGGQDLNSRRVFLELQVL